MVYSILLPQDYSDEAYAQLYSGLRPLLPDFRRAKADASLSAKTRVSSALAYLLLCHGLQKEYSFPAAAKPEFVYGAAGNAAGNSTHSEKPFLAPPCGSIFFSLSHCRTGIACALSDGPVGVDIQDIRNIKKSAVQKFFGGLDKECAQLAQELQEAISSPSAFTALWSRYEAYVKLTGDGISCSFSDCGGLSEEFLLQNNISIATLPLFRNNQIGASDSLPNKKEAAAHLSAASYGSAAKCSSSSEAADFYFECLDFSDFCHSLLSQHS